MSYSRKNGLGSIFPAIIKGQQVKVRKIIGVGEISNLMFGKLVDEIKRWSNEILYRYIENYIGTFQDQGETYIVSDYHPECINLKSVISKNRLLPGMKLELIKQLARVMSYCTNLKQPMNHGHLHPENVLVRRMS